MTDQLKAIRLSSGALRCRQSLSPCSRQAEPRANPAGPRPFDDAANRALRHRPPEHPKDHVRARACPTPLPARRCAQKNGGCPDGQPPEVGRTEARLASGVNLTNSFWAIVGEPTLICVNGAISSKIILF
jgi:hypothetical protein